MVKKTLVMQIHNISKKQENEARDRFRMMPAVIVMTLMMIFLGSTVYVLISSLL